MKILLLADAASSHTKKWSIALAERGFTVAIFSLNYSDSKWAIENNIQLFFSSSDKRYSSSIWSKVLYLTALPALKRTIRTFKPEIIHAHYATSYGLIGNLSGFKPFFITAWGTDIILFPGKSIFHKLLLRWTLNESDKLLAPSSYLRNEIKKITNKPVTVIPFGVDTNIFQPNRSLNLFPTGYSVIGIIKSLESVYRIDLIIEAFSIIKRESLSNNWKLLIVGGGSLENQLKEKVAGLKLQDDVIFTGRVSPAEVIKYHNSIDIYLNVSDNESLGVSILESSACEKPVIATRVGGIPEVLLENETGCLIDRGNVIQLAEKIMFLIHNPDTAKEMGIKGRTFVKQNYEWSNCMDKMIFEYENVKSHDIK
ncbi:MAG: glycosyltransferase [Bacteroidetes bacterium]|jgi:glycosyltransferase involved in cell wall biosynthesis|nr:glycosyltransferase [Bacteroidota bacterium]